MKKIVLILLISALQSCLYDHSDHTKELGNNYYYMGDGRESQILLGKTDNRSIGKTIVPEEVTHYNFNADYIIARNIQDKYSKEVRFWIIDKRQELQPVPLDSIEFAELIQKLNIDLKLQPRE